MSRVTMIGGLGLFFDPGGRPRTRRIELPGSPPELVVVMAVLLSCSKVVSSSAAAAAALE